MTNGSKAIIIKMFCICLFMYKNKERNLHRTFIAVDFPDSVIKEVARVQEVLGNLKFTGKMTELENLHVTLKFLGEISGERLNEVKKRLEGVKFEGFEANLDSIGSFNYHRNPRIIWIKVGGRWIFELQKKVDRVLSDLFKPEERFMSHMTIARVKYVKDKKGFDEYVKGIKLKDIRFEIDRLKLKESELRDVGPVYRDIEIYGLNKI